MVQLRKWLNPSTNHPVQTVLSQNASAHPWPLSWQGDGYLGKAKLFPLDVSPEWFLGGCKHRASSWLPALLFDQQGFSSACAAKDLPTPPDWLTLKSRELPLLPGVTEQRVTSYWWRQGSTWWSSACTGEREKQGLSLAPLTGCSRQKQMFPLPSALEEPAASHRGEGWAQPTACPVLFHELLGYKQPWPQTG